MKHLLVFVLIVQTRSQKIQIKRVTNHSVDIQCKQLFQENNFELLIWKTKYGEFNDKVIWHIINLKINQHEYSKTFNDLYVGTNYTAQLRGRNRKSDGNKIIILDKVEFVTKPNPPNNFGIREIQEKSAVITWIEPIFLSSYYLLSVTDYEQQIVYYSEVKLIDHLDKFQRFPRFRITKLRPGKKYTVFAVSTVPGLNHGISVSEPLIHCFKTKPLPPTDLSVDQKSLSSHSLTIHWKHPKSSELDYYYIECEANEKILKSINKTLNKTTFNSLDPGLTYQIKLTAIVKQQDHLIESRPVLLNVTTPPLPIINLKITTMNESNLTLEWTTDEHSINFTYEVSYYDLDSNDEEEVDLLSNQTISYISDLIPGHNYSISVSTLSQYVASNVTTIYHFISDKTKILKIIISLVTIFLISLMTTAIYLFYDIYKKNFTNDPSIENNTIELQTIEEILPIQAINNSAMSATEQNLSIDQDIMINRNDLEIGELIGLGHFGAVYSGLLQLKIALLVRKENVAIKASSKLSIFINYQINK